MPEDLDELLGKVKPAAVSAPVASGDDLDSLLGKVKPAAKPTLERPGMPKAPVPAELRKDYDIGEEFGHNAPGLGGEPPAAEFLRPTVRGVSQMIGGVERLAEPAQAVTEDIGRTQMSGMGQPLPGKPSVTPKLASEAAKGAHEVMSGAMEAAIPALVVAGGMAPVGTMIGVGTAVGVRAGTEHVLKALGLPEEYAAVAGDLAGIFGSGVILKGLATAAGRAYWKSKFKDYLQEKLNREYADKKAAEKAANAPKQIEATKEVGPAATPAQEPPGTPPIKEAEFEDIPKPAEAAKPAAKPADELDALIDQIKPAAEAKPVEKPALEWGTGVGEWHSEEVGGQRFQIEKKGEKFALTSVDDAGSRPVGVFKTLESAQKAAVPVAKKEEIATPEKPSPVEQPSKPVSVGASAPIEAPAEKPVTVTEEPKPGAEVKSSAPQPSPEMAAKIDGMKLPDYVKDTLRDDVGLAGKLGVVQKIEDLSADRLTADEVARKLNLPGDTLDSKRIVRSVRAVLGIPSMDDKAGFESWLNSRNDLSGSGQPEVTPPTPPKEVIQPQTTEQSESGEIAAPEPTPPATATEAPSARVEPQKTPELATTSVNPPSNEGEKPEVTSPKPLTNQKVRNLVKKTDAELLRMAHEQLDAQKPDALGSPAQQTADYQKDLVLRMDAKKLSEADRQTLNDILGLPEGTIAVHGKGGKVTIEKPAESASSPSVKQEPVPVNKEGTSVSPVGVTMKPQEFAKEHEALPDVLRNGTQAERNAEAAKQEKELQEVKAVQSESEVPKPTSRSHAEVERMTQATAAKPVERTGAFDSLPKKANITIPSKMIKSISPILKSLAAKKSTIPILQNIAIVTKKGKTQVFATDLETAVVFTLPPGIAKTDGAITIPMSAIDNAIKGKGKEDLNISAEGDKAKISVGSSESTANLMGVDSYPELPATPEKVGTILAQSLLKAARLAVPVISPEESRFTLNGALLTIKEGKATIAATDGHRLLVHKFDVPGVAEETTLLIPRKALDTYSKVFAKDEGNLYISTDKKSDEVNYIGVESKSKTERVLSRKMSGNFPDYTRVIPDENQFVAKATVGRVDLLGLAKQVVALKTRDGAIALSFRNGSLASYRKADDTETKGKIGATLESVGTKAGEEPGNQRTSLNAHYIADFLNSTDADKIEVMIKDPSSAVVMRPVGDPNTTMVIMPMRDANLEGFDEELKSGPKAVTRHRNSEAGSASPNLLTLGAAKAIQEDVIPAIKKAAAALVDAKKDIVSLIAPASAGPNAPRTAGVVRMRASELSRSTDRAMAALEDAHKTFDGLPENVRLDFIDRIETGRDQDNPHLQKMADIMRDMLDERRQMVQDLGTGKLENYYENYFPHLWEDPNKAKQFFSGWFAKRPLEGSKSFLKQRKIPTIKDGMVPEDQGGPGLVPLSTNPVDLVVAKVREMDKYLMAHHTLADLKEMGILKYVPVGKKPPEDYQKINDNIATVYGPRTGAVKLPEGANITPEEVNVVGQRIMGHYYAPEDAARVVNNYLSPGLREKSGAFRAYLGAANMLNQFQLGWSAFHLGFTSVDAYVSGMALGIYKAAHGYPLRGAVDILKSPIELAGVPIGLAAKAIGRATATDAAERMMAPFSTILRGDKLMKEWLHPGTQGAETAALVDAAVKAGGRAKMDAFYTTQVSKRMMETLRQGNIWGAMFRVPFAATEQAMRLIMEYIVPRQKLGVFSDLAKFELERLGPDASEEDVRAALGKAWDSVDNRLGQLVYDNLFWNKVLKDLLMGSVRSVGWNTGTVREGVGGAADTVAAAADAIRGKKPDMTTRMSYIMALPIAIGLMGAVLHYLNTGEAPEEIKDYYFPRRGKRGTPGWDKRMSIPSYVKDVVHYSHDVTGAVAGKIHPLLNTIIEMLQNKDFYEKPIAKPGDPIVKKALSEAEFLMKQAEPLAVRPWLNPDKKKGTATTSEKLLPFIGVTEAPAYVKRPTQQYRTVRIPVKK